jgi:hypothetical protein
MVSYLEMCMRHQKLKVAAGLLGVGFSAAAFFVTHRAEAAPCYIAYVHGSGSDLQYITTHSGFDTWIPSTSGEGGDWIEREWTPDRSPNVTTTNSFTYYSSRSYDPAQACAIFRVGYNGYDYWWQNDAAGLVARQINQFIDQEAIPDGRLIIVTHSMGGVLGRWILDNGVANAPFYNYNGDDYEKIVRKTQYMITVDAPHGGTQVADAIYGEADHYFSDAGGAMALIFGGQDRSNARDSLRRGYMADAATWMGDAGRYRTIYTVGGDSVEDDAGEGMDADGDLQTAWGGVCYRRAWFNGWGALCGVPGVAVFTFNDVAGDGLVELASAGGTILKASFVAVITHTNVIAGARRNWLNIHDNHNQGRYDMHSAPIHDLIGNATQNNYPGSYIGQYGLNLPCSAGALCAPVIRGRPPG